MSDLHHTSNLAIVMLRFHQSLPTDSISSARPHTFAGVYKPVALMHWPNQKISNALRIITNMNMRTQRVRVMCNVCELFCTSGPPQTTASCHHVLSHHATCRITLFLLKNIDYTKCKHAKPYCHTSRRRCVCECRTAYPSATLQTTWKAVATYHDVCEYACNLWLV